MNYAILPDFETEKCVFTLISSLRRHPTLSYVCMRELSIMFEQEFKHSTFIQFRDTPCVLYVVLARLLCHRLHYIVKPLCFPSMYVHEDTEACEMNSAESGIIGVLMNQMK